MIYYIDVEQFMYSSSLTLHEFPYSLLLCHYVCSIYFYLLGTLSQIVTIFGPEWMAKENDPVSFWVKRPIFRVDLLLVSGSVIYQAKKQAPFLLRRLLDLTNSSEIC